MRVVLGRIVRGRTVCGKSYCFRWIGSRCLTVGSIVNPRPPLHLQRSYSHKPVLVLYTPNQPSTDLPPVDLTLSITLRTINSWTTSHDDWGVIFGLPDSVLFFASWMSIIAGLLPWSSTERVTAPGQVGLQRFVTVHGAGNSDMAAFGASSSVLSLSDWLNWQHTSYNCKILMIAGLFVPLPTISRKLCSFLVPRSSSNEGHWFSRQVSFVTTLFERLMSVWEIHAITISRRKVFLAVFFNLQKPILVFSYGKFIPLFHFVLLPMPVHYFST